MATTFRHITSMVLDELKLLADDATYTHEHIMFYASKLRAYLLEQKYKNDNSPVSDENYQEICTDLEQVDAIPGTMCTGTYLRTTKALPEILGIGSVYVYPVDIFSSWNIIYTSIERMQFAGTSKWFKNFIYVAQGIDGRLYFKSGNYQFLYLKNVRIKAVFADPEEAAELACDDTATCDTLDATFPLESELIILLIYRIVQEFTGARYMPTDNANNAKDDMSGMMGATPYSTTRAATRTKQAQDE